MGFNDEHVNLADLTIKHYETKIRLLYADGVVNKDDLIIASIDRSEGRTYKAVMSTNNAPTLTTHNQYLFALQVKEVVEQVPDNERQWFRKLRDTERLTLQGFPKTLALDLKGKTRFAAGNAFPVPVIVAMLHPMLEALSKSSLDLATWPPMHMLSRKDLECVAVAAKQMKAKPRKVKTVRKALKVKQTTLVRKALKDKKTEFIL